MKPMEVGSQKPVRLVLRNIRGERRVASFFTSDREAFPLRGPLVFAIAD